MHRHTNAEKLNALPYTQYTYTLIHWGVYPVWYFSMGSIARVVCRVFTFASVTAKHFLHIPSLFHTLMRPSTPSTHHTPQPPPITSACLTYIYFFMSLLSFNSSSFPPTVSELFLWLGVGGGFEMNVKCFFRSSVLPSRALPRLVLFSATVCVCVSVFVYLLTCVLSVHSVALTTTPTHIPTNRLVTFLWGKTGLRLTTSCYPWAPGKLWFWEFDMLECVTLCLCVHVYVLHGIGRCGMKKMSWCWHCLMTLSLLVSLWVTAEKEDVRQRKFHTRCCAVAGVLFFHAMLECKKLKICVYFSDGYREFFTLCLIREGEEERWGKTEGCRESGEMFVCVCVQH